MLKSRKILALVVFILLYCLLRFDVYLVPSSSMEPTILQGDLIIIKKYFHHNILNFNTSSNVKKGEILVFYRLDSSLKKIFFVKRCYTIPGDSVLITREKEKTSKNNLGIDIGEFGAY